MFTRIGRCTAPPATQDGRMTSLLAVSPPVLGLGGLWIALVVLVPIAIFGMVVYSIYTLRKPENWEQR
jgi:hypothetical protein